LDEREAVQQDHRPADEEPALDPHAADRAVRGGGFDTAGYGRSHAAAETDATPEEVAEAWSEAQEDIDETDLRLMDPADRLEPGREPREGE
jgi:hypothetical protein